MEYRLRRRFLGSMRYGTLCAPIQLSKNSARKSSHDHCNRSREQWEAKIVVDAIREVCPACVPETGLGLLGMRMRTQSVTRGCRTAK